MNLPQIPTILVLAGLLTASGCEKKPADSAPGKITSDQVGRDIDQAVKTAVEFSQQAKEEFQMNLERQLQDLDTEIGTLREKGSNLRDDAKAQWDRTMAELDTKREAVRTRLAQAGQSTADAWKETQQEAQSAWEDLSRAFRDAKREFESTAKPD